MSDELFAKYDGLIQVALEKYFQAYKAKYPEARNFDTAKEFMDQNYDSYRREVAAIGTAIMHEAGLGDNAITRKIIEQNKYSIGALFGEIMNDALN